MNKIILIATFLFGSGAVWSQTYPWGKVPAGQIEDVFLRNDQADTMQSDNAALTINAQQPGSSSQPVLRIQNQGTDKFTVRADGSMTLVGTSEFQDLGNFKKDIKVGSFSGSDDDSIYFDDGSSEYLRWVDSLGGYFILSDDLRLPRGLYVGDEATNDDDFIFFDGGSKYFYWDDNPGRFCLTDSLELGGGLTTFGVVSIHDQISIAAADKKVTQPQDSSGSGPFNINGRFTIMSLLSWYASGANQYWYAAGAGSGGSPATRSFPVLLEIPVEVFGGTVVVDQIIVYCETTHNNLWWDSWTLRKFDRSGSTTYVADSGTDYGNGSTGDLTISLLSSDLSRATHTTPLVLMIYITDTSGAGGEFRFYDVEVRYHLE